MKRDKNKELMLAAGSKTGQYDPEAPDQWKWVLRHGEGEERALAWIKSKTIAWPHDSPFCVDEHGNPLYIPHMATECEWTPQTATNYLVSLRSQGRANFEKGKKRIWYTADIPQAHNPRVAEATEGSAEDSDNEDGRTEGENFNSVQSYCPPYLADFIEKLPNDKRSVATAKWEANLRWRRDFMADGMAALRTIADRVEDTTLQEIGIPKKRLPKRRAAEVKWVQVKLFEEPNFVQSCVAEFVQNGKSASYKPETDFVDARAVVIQQQQQHESAPRSPSSVQINGNNSPAGRPPQDSSSSKPIELKKKTGSAPKGDDDEKPKPKYASARDEVKAIHYAKTGTYPTVHLLDRIEGILVSKGETWDSFLDMLKPHLGGNWKIPGAFLTHVAKTGFEPLASPPQEKPKPKCPTCKSDNQRGAILLNGAIVPCPDCSTSVEWRAELTAKMQRSPISNGQKGATA